jgi:hypothetical protein
MLFVLQKIVKKIRIPEKGDMFPFLLFIITVHACFSANWRGLIAE